jgi:hypothetical protein
MINHQILTRIQAAFPSAAIMQPDKEPTAPLGMKPFILKILRAFYLIRTNRRKINRHNKQLSLQRPPKPPMLASILQKNVKAKLLPMVNTHKLMLKERSI